MEFYHEIIDLAEKFWGFIILIAGGVGGYLKWRSSRKKSTNMLLDELEALKQKIVIQISKDVKSATTIARQEILLEQLKLHCPDCYEKALENIKSEMG